MIKNGRKSTKPPSCPASPGRASPTLTLQVREIQSGHADYIGDKGEEEGRVETGGVIADKKLWSASMLRLHALSGRLQGLHSVSINISYRITLELLIQDDEIIPVNVGDHEAVY